MLEAFNHFASGWSYFLMGLALLSLLAWVVLLVLYFWNKLFKTAPEEEETFEKEGITHPVVGYKTANIDSITLDENDAIVDIVLRGLVGKTYSAADKTGQSGLRKFNMYSNADDALEHKQNWGSTFLEVVGFGDVEEHERGYTAQRQRVLQVGFLECSEMYSSKIKCLNEAEFLACDNEEDAAKLTGYKTYCAGCVKRKIDAKRIFPYFNKVFTIGSGHDVVVMGKSSREKADFLPTVLGSEEGEGTTGDDDKGGEQS